MGQILRGEWKKMERRKSTEESIITELKYLRVGEKIKNYGQLCSKLHLKPCTGNAKIKQMKVISQYIELEKDKQQFEVKKIYSLQEHLDNYPLDNKVEVMKKLFLVNFEKDVKCHLTSIKLASSIGLCKFDYRKIKLSKKETEIKNYVDSNIRVRVSNLLVKLEKEKFINYKNVIVCVFKDTSEYILNDEEYKIIHKYLKYSYLTDVSKTAILDAMRETLGIDFEDYYYAYEFEVKKNYFSKKLNSKKLIKRFNDYMCDKLISQNNNVTDYVNKYIRMGGK